MTTRLLAVGAAVTAMVLTTGVAATPRPDVGQTWIAETQTAPPDQVVQAGPGQGPGPRQQPGVRPGGPGRMGPGQMGPGQTGRGRGGPGQGTGPEMRRGPLAGPRLDLTDEQRTKIEGLRRGLRDQTAAIDDELQMTRRALHREVFADKRDAARVTTLATKVAALEKQLLDLRLKTEAAVADLLTAEQKETMRISGGGPGGPGFRGRGRGGLAGARPPATTPRAR